MRIRKTITAVSATLLALGAASFIASHSRGDERKPGKPTLALEVRIERGDVLSRVTVSIHNRAEELYSFDTGARGGSGGLDDAYRGDVSDAGRQIAAEIEGTRPKVVPELTFRVNAGRITITPPRLSGTSDSLMANHREMIRPGERLEYASFAVPSFYVAGEFVGARLQLPTGPIATRTLATAAPDDAPKSGDAG